MTAKDPSDHRGDKPLTVQSLRAELPTRDNADGFDFTTSSSEHSLTVSGPVYMVATKDCRVQFAVGDGTAPDADRSEAPFLAKGVVLPGFAPPRSCRVSVKGVSEAGQLIVWARGEA